MGIEEVHLSLQLFRGHPIIVTLEKGQILTSAGRQRRLKISHGADILVSQQRYNSFRISPVEIHKNFTGSIGRAVFADDDLVIEGHPLREDAFKSLRNESLMIIGDHHHAELHSSILA